MATIPNLCPNCREAHGVIEVPKGFRGIYMQVGLSDDGNALIVAQCAEHSIPEWYKLDLALTELNVSGAGNDGIRLTLNPTGTMIHGRCPQCSVVGHLSVDAIKADVKEISRKMGG